MKNKKLYNKNFFDARLDKINKTARVIVPIIMKIISPKSIVDFGCGSGEFLSIFKKIGVDDVLGIDGDWLKTENLLIPKNLFRPYNLEKYLKLNKRYNFAMCLETAEHIHKKYAKNLVKSLTGAAPIILFSAAIPFQYGTGHINEEWLDYWAALFEEKGYLPIDCIRSKIWKNKNISVYYKQNMIFFAEKKYINKNKKLKELFKVSENDSLAKVHPDFYLIKANNTDFYLRNVPKFVRKLIKSLFELKNKLKSYLFHGEKEQ